MEKRRFRLAEYTHGGDILSAKARYGGEILDFSANLNPLGMPGAVRAAARAAVDGCVHYPDPLCRELTAAIAARDRVEPGQILCGNGAADLIFRLAIALRPARALVTAPTVSEYAQALGAVGTQVFSHRLYAKENFDLTERVLEELTPGLDVFFLCSPNNPTGRRVKAPLMEQILHQCGENRILLVVDECFLSLSDGAGPGLAPRLAENPHLLLLRAFTKSYAIPGLRLGYCLSADGALLERLSLCGQPWSVSGAAQAAGIAAMGCPRWPEEARKLIQTERSWLLEQMSALNLKIWPGEANYLLFQAPGRADLKERLMERGILIRSCANYEGLGPDFYRIAVRPHGENERLISALKEVL